MTFQNVTFGTVPLLAQKLNFTKNQNSIFVPKVVSQKYHFWYKTFLIFCKNAIFVPKVGFQIPEKWPFLRFWFLEKIFLKSMQNCVLH